MRPIPRPPCPLRCSFWGTRHIPASETPDLCRPLPAFDLRDPALSLLEHSLSWCAAPGNDELLDDITWKLFWRDWRRHEVRSGSTKYPHRKAEQCRTDFFQPPRPRRRGGKDARNGGGGQASVISSIVNLLNTSKYYLCPPRPSLQALTS